MSARSGSKTGVHCTTSTLSAPVASIMRRSKPSAAPLASGISASAAEEILVDRGGGSVNALLFLHVGLEPPPLLGRIGEFVERVRQFDPATVEFEPFGDPRIVGTEARERRLARRVGVKDGRRGRFPDWVRPVR